MIFAYVCRLLIDPDICDSSGDDDELPSRMYRIPELYPVENVLNTRCTDCDDEPEYSTTEHSMLLLYHVEFANDTTMYDETSTVAGPRHDDDM